MIELEAQREWHIGSSEDYHTTNNTKRSGPAPEWKTSLAKAYLQKQLMDDKSPFHSMTPEQIHKSWDGFGDYPLTNFKSNLKNLAEAVSKRKKIVEEDERIFQLEQRRFPRKEITTTGKHYWDKHPANELLLKMLRMALQIC